MLPGLAAWTLVPQNYKITYYHDTAGEVMITYLPLNLDTTSGDE